MKQHMFFKSVIALAAVLFMSLPAQAALAPSTTYTVTVEAIQSNGTMTRGSSSLKISSLGATDSTSKLSFSLSGVPSNADYNFLVITIVDPTGAVARQSIVPAPAPGNKLDLGVSQVTANQTSAFLKVFASAGTDDPLLAFFGFLLVRSADVTENEILQMANFCYLGIKGTDGTGLTNGFEASLRDDGATDAMLAQFRTNLVSNLSSLVELYKESVDQFFSGGSDAELAKRGQAAGALFEYLVNAASDAGMNEEWLLMGFNSMGAVVLPLMDQAIASGLMRSSVEKGMSATIDRGLQKLRADNFLKKYTNALTVLGASAAELSKFTTAVNTLQSTMQDKFEEFEKTVMKDDGAEADDIDSFNTEMSNEMEAAFNQFIADSEASDDEIADMIDNLETAYSVPGGTLNPAMFKFFSRDGQLNWPIMMVVVTNWLAEIITDGGNITSYSRDTLPIPVAMTIAGGGWKDARTTFTNPPWSIPGAAGGLIKLLEIREDIEIAEFTRYASFAAMSNDPAQAMEDMDAAEEAFYDKVEEIADKIGGTTDGTTLISDAIKDAIVTIFLSPDF